MTLPTFNNPALLVTALTHRSALNEGLSTSLESNERLEFLGDAVLELASTEFLFQQMPEAQEGLLTAIRSALVRTTTLAEVAQELQLGEQLFMSKGEEASGGRHNTGLLANAVEALIGATYLDQGIDAVKKMLQQYIFPKLDEIMRKKLYKDPKTQLQELVQAQGFSAPEYTVIKESGPDHDREFTITVKVQGKEYATGTGKSKQLAQQNAAQQVLEKLNYEWPTAAATAADSTP